MSRVLRLTVALVALWLSGCEDDNVAPVADAGPDLTAAVGTVVALSGAASRDADGDPLTYRWAITSKPADSRVTLANASAVDPSFMPDQAGSYVVSLIVNDGKFDSAPATVTVRVPLSPQAQADLALATAARLEATYLASTKSIRLEWQDSFPEGTRYQVEVQSGDGPFLAVETVEGIGVPGALTRSGLLPRGPRAFRVQALHQGRTVPLLSASGQPQWVDTLTGEPSILLDAPEPLGSTTRLSVSIAQPFSTVRWRIDAGPVVPGDDAPGRPYTWNVAGEASGTHRVQARVALSADTTVELVREVVVANGKPGIGVLFLSAGMEVMVAANTGVAKVAVTLDGLPVTDPCPERCDRLSNSYLFDIASVGLRSGAHVAVVTVTDSLGQTVSRSVEFVVKNPPKIELDSPADGSFLFENFRLAGRFTPDQPGTVTVKVLIDGQVLSETRGTSLDRVLPLDNLLPGSHRLTVIAVGSTGASGSVEREVVVASSAALRHSPLAKGSLYAVEGDRIVYFREDGAMAIRNVAAGSEVILGMDGRALVGGGLSNGQFSASMSGAPDCPVFDCIYLWTASGARRRLSEGGSSFGLALSGGKAAWRDSSNPSDRAGFTVYDAATGQRFQVPPPQDAPWTDDYPVLVARPGTTELFFSARPVSTSEAGRDLFRWSSLTVTTTRLTRDGRDNTRPAIDGQRMAWSRDQQPGSSIGELVLRDIDGASERLVTNAFGGFEFADGLLVWELTLFSDPRAGTDARQINVLGPTGALTLVGGQGVGLLGSGAGHVAYRRSDPPANQGRPRVWSWNAATGRHTLRVDVAPRVSRLSGGWLYFEVGGSIYRTALD